MTRDYLPHIPELDALVRSSVMEVTDIAESKKLVIAAALAHPHWKDWERQLAKWALVKLVDNDLHSINVELKREGGKYGGPSKVDAMGEAVADMAHKTLLDNFRIDGTVLGDILGSQLLPIAKNQRAIGSGYEKKAMLCEALARRVPATKRVRDAVQEIAVRKLYNKIFKPAAEEALALA